MKLNYQICEKLFLSFGFSFITSCAYNTTQSINQHPSTPIQISNDFIWGINGHPIEDIDYKSIPLEKQLKLLKEHQMTYYRIDINTRINGNVETKDNRKERLNSLLKNAQKLNIKILPVLKFYNIHLDKKIFNEKDAYDKGKMQAMGFAEKYKDYFDYYGLGNELDLKAIFPNRKGRKLEDYDLVKMKLIISYLKGMIQGIDEADPTAKTIINCALQTHWGYLDFLKKNDVKYDIIGYHWYSENGQSLFNTHDYKENALKILESYNKPIWLTEISKKRGSLHQTEKTQNEMMNIYIQDLNNKKAIQAFFVYELFDQPNLINADWAGPEEAYYGIIGWESTPPDYSKYYYKPVSDVLKYRIEEANKGYEDFIYSVLLNLYEKESNEQDLRYWTARFQILRNKELVIKEILETTKAWGYQKLINPDQSNQSKDLSSFIASVYKIFLKRNPDEKEIKYWNRRLKKRVKSEDFPIKIMLSEEYWQNAIWSGYEKRTGYARPH